MRLLQNCSDPFAPLKYIELVTMEERWKDNPAILSTIRAALTRRREAQKIEKYAPSSQITSV